MTTDEFTADRVAKKVQRRDGTDVRLTPAPWHLLELLIRNPGRLISRRRPLEEVRGHFAGNRTDYLRVCMVQLRRNPEAEPPRPRHLITEPGMGYRFGE
ncbi:winged helix-turn-helix domain-containing protein [Streptomyces sp. FIT100]|uniref:winged helix-turn-helix domain-containing protein n=1 Tax=Streptomyces sp. FIT100 TaxID=2837956 RepID=UPI0021FF0AD3|nr:winged helix-turn-helix domain-containing protein [Streptomyces sp. FIT100]